METTSQRTVEKKPWWVSGEEKKGVEETPQVDLANALQDAVPAFERVEKGDLIAEYGVKDDLLLFHFYKKDRREIYDRAHAAIDKVGQLYGRAPQADVEIAKISKEANADLEQCPWWPDFEAVAAEVFQDHFRYQPHKLTYYMEVDSWSLMLPQPTIMAQTKPQFHETFVSKLALRLSGG
jgi:hypothetical protein